MKTFLSYAFLTVLTLQILGVCHSRVCATEQTHFTLACKDCGIAACRDCGVLPCKDCGILACKDCGGK
jgi:hypothetical protein